MIKNKIFNKVLEDGISKCPKDKRYVVLHVFSGHMAIYCEYYDDIAKMADVIANGISDPQGAAEVKVIYSMEDKEILYCDFIGMAFTIHDHWEKINNYNGKRCVPEIKVNAGQVYHHYLSNKDYTLVEDSEHKGNFLWMDKDYKIYNKKLFPLIKGNSTTKDTILTLLELEMIKLY